MNKQRFYNWEDTLSQQIGHQEEICIVVGPKDIGKTFELLRRSQFDYQKIKAEAHDMTTTTNASDETLRTINEHYEKHC